MKHTPADISRVANLLSNLDHQNFNEIPSHIYHHFYNEISVAFLNWIGRGRNEDVEETLNHLKKVVFSNPDLAPPKSLTGKQRFGLQLRSHCAMLSLYLKVNTSASYNSMLIGTRNETRRTILQALFSLSQQKSNSINRAFNLQLIKTEIKNINNSNKGVTRQNIHYNINWLIDKGLLIEEKSGLNVNYRLSDRGYIECNAHFLQTDLDQTTISKSENSSDETKVSPNDLPIEVSESFDALNNSSDPIVDYSTSSRYEHGKLTKEEVLFSKNKAKILLSQFKPDWIYKAQEQLIALNRNSKNTVVTEGNLINYEKNRSILYFEENTIFKVNQIDIEERKNKKILNLAIS
ncbi:hypothetical protein GCM10028818_59110 [Spirosoma horti]